MASQQSPRPILDHIVILVSYDTLFEVPDRLKDSFSIIHGGEHSGGETVNKLIILPDGSYIELIAFTKGLDPEVRRAHRWGNLQEGRIIDWAYTLPAEPDFKLVQQRVEGASSSTGIVYQDPVAGGRTRPDGVVLKWAVSGTLHHREGDHHSHHLAWPGDAPFWCFDRTPRNLRVPYQDAGRDDGLAEHSIHPSGARGISRVSVQVPQKYVARWKQVYDAIHQGSTGAQDTDGVWTFDTYSGSTEGSRQVSLSPLGEQETQSHIKLTLLGTDKSPKSVELIPGVVLDFESP
ncbi:glyoxalase-like domain-containing protein [Mariannaea sp. PMI_226]|nr:glyoxalase-like domain-containing protein [Mariannaea sp. PMI_226]